MDNKIKPIDISIYKGVDIRHALQPATHLKEGCTSKVFDMYVLAYECLEIKKTNIIKCPFCNEQIATCTYGSKEQAESKRDKVLLNFLNTVPPTNKH